MYLESDYAHIVCMLIATSKQRTSLRRAIAADKKKMMECIAQYNDIVAELYPSEDNLSIDEIMDGKFPWSAITGTNIINLQYCLIKL